MKTRKVRYMNLKSRKIVSAEELRDLLSNMNHSEAQFEATLWVACSV